jgi:DNA-binding MltR family transcriptional regulator
MSEKQNGIGDEKESEELELAGEWSDHFEISTRQESVRAKVVLAACYFEELLEQLIKMVLKESDEKEDPLLDGPQVPIGTFSAKIETAYRLGFITPEVKKSLHLIRKIRNKFSHELSSCTFDDEQIKNWNLELHKLNDVATAEKRKLFTPGPVGDFEKSAAWLIFWIKTVIGKVSVKFPNCGSEREQSKKIKLSRPN